MLNGGIIYPAIHPSILINQATQPIITSRNINVDTLSDNSLFETFRSLHMLPSVSYLWLCFELVIVGLIVVNTVITIALLSSRLLCHLLMRFEKDWELRLGRWTKHLDKQWLDHILSEDKTHM